MSTIAANVPTCLKAIHISPFAIYRLRALARPVTYE
jgi:hypothetical protein